MNCIFRRPVQNSGCWQVCFYAAFRQIKSTRKTYSVCVVQYSSGKVSQLSCIHKILSLSFKQNCGVHVTWWEGSHIPSCVVGSCIHVAVCDLNGHWWSDRRNLVSVPLWKQCRSSPICLRDWPPPAILGVERLLGVVEASSTLVCLDSSPSRRHCYHPRGLCANYQHTGCLSVPSSALLSSFPVVFWKDVTNQCDVCADTSLGSHQAPVLLATPSSWHSQNCMLSERRTCWFKLSSHITDKDPCTKTMCNYWRKGRCWSPNYGGYLYRS